LETRREADTTRSEEPGQSGQVTSASTTPSDGTVPTPAEQGTESPPGGMPSPKEYARILLVAAVLGLPAAALGAILMSVIHGLTTLMWTTIPDAFNWTSPAGWYVVVIPALGGLLVAGVLRLPGHGGESPAAGFSLEPLSPLHAASALLAAIISLGFGSVLGPEAPLIVVGTTTGLIASRWLRSGPSQGQLLIIAGAFATISTLFGGPLVSALLLLEMLAFSGRVASKSLIPAIIPGFLASGTAALVFTGIDSWPGIHLNALSVGTLPNYPTVRLADIAWCVPVAVVAAAVVAVVRTISHQSLTRVASIRPVYLLVGAGIAMGLLAVIFRAISGQAVDLVLFSGETALPSITAETSAGIILLLILCKGGGYLLSLGSGFRGGPTFPAVTVGVAVGVLGSVVLPGLDLTPAVIAGMAAGAAGVFDMAIFGALLAAFLAGTAITVETIPIAVIASVVGWVVTTTIKTRAEARQPAGETA
jgi:H+/Cl- antiporter ClcA